MGNQTKRRKVESEVCKEDIQDHTSQSDGFTGERLGPLVIRDEGGIGAEDTLYDGLFSLIDDLLEPQEDPGTIQLAN